MLPAAPSHLYQSTLRLYGLAVSKACLQLAFVALLSFACSNGQRLSPDAPSRAANATSSTGVPSPTSSFSADPPPSPDPSASTARPEGSDAPAGGSSAGPPPRPSAQAIRNVAPVPKLTDAAGQPLPQTDELPSFDSPSFQRRIELVFEAIIKDDPKLATPAFFPVIAYEQVKDISQPARDHKRRLLTAFAKNIHDYHRQVSKLDTPKLVEVVPSTLAARWMKPGTEGNRLGYFRLLRSKLKIADANGKELLLEMTSMISWRGEWYVVHLNGFK